MRKAGRKAGILIELGISLPILILLALGCSDLGRFAHYYIAVGNAAGAGALFGSLHPVTATSQTTWNSMIRQTATNEIATVLGYNSAYLSIPDPQLISETSSNFKRVRVQVTYRFQTLISWPGIQQDYSLTRTVEMRVVR